MINDFPPFCKFYFFEMTYPWVEDIFDFSKIGIQIFLKFYWFLINLIYNLGSLLNLKAN